jgi:hypothetical protein
LLSFWIYVEKLNNNRFSYLFLVLGTYLTWSNFYIAFLFMKRLADEPSFKIPDFIVYTTLNAN